MGISHTLLFAVRALGALLLVLVAPWALAAAAVDVKTSHAGDLVEVRAHASISAPLDVVWGTLTDYERLPQFIPGLRTSKVIARNGATATVQQSGEARFFFLTVPIDVTLESTESPPTIEVRRVSGNLKQLQGRYETEVSADGAQVQLRWIGSVAPENGLPPLVGEAMMRRSIRQQFTGMVREIERREAARLALLPALPPAAPSALPAPTAK
jgi:ribosome-associated toxin RatA of RatAB toxin-antitoxin module